MLTHSKIGSSQRELLSLWHSSMAHQPLLPTKNVEPPDSKAFGPKSSKYKLEWKSKNWPGHCFLYFHFVSTPTLHIVITIYCCLVSSVVMTFLSSSPLCWSRALAQVIKVNVSHSAWTIHGSFDAGCNPFYHRNDWITDIRASRYHSKKISST